MNQVDISIIVPIYNVELYLEKCINSILNQTFKNFELLLVNDGSTDNSGEICDKYARLDNRIKVIHKENGGVSSARNAGLNVAIGRYIGFVDPDDYIDSQMYEKLYNLCKKTYSYISVCKLGREINGEIKHSIEEENTMIFNQEEALKELFKGILYRFSLCNKLFNKKCFEGVNFPEGRIHEDLSTCYRLFSNAEKVVYTNFPGYIYVRRENSILTSKYSEKRLQAFEGWQEIIKYMSDKHPTVMDEVYACFGYICLDHSIYILKQFESVIEQKKFIDEIRSYILKNRIKLSKNKLLNLKTKFILLLISINPRIFLAIYRFKNIA